MGLPMAEEQQAPKDPHELERKDIAMNLASVGRKVGIHSGKGGVGKTFLATNLAIALTASGKRVGLLDADVDCPNVARFLNLADVPLGGTSDGRILPLEYKDMKIVSTHFLSERPDLPMIVRGPIKHKVLAQLLAQVDWGELDVLLYDLPPGTSDVPMSTMQIGNLDGMVIVTTPQKEAIMDARKSVIMAKDLGVPVIGIVENMSGEVFGEGKGERLAKEMGVPFLGTIPLSTQIRKFSERGKAALIEHPACKDVAARIMAGVMGADVLVQKARFKWW